MRMALLSSMLEVILCTSLLAETVGAVLYSMLNGAHLPKKDWSYFFMTVLATSASSYHGANALSAQRVSGRSVRQRGPALNS